MSTSLRIKLLALGLSCAVSGSAQSVHPDRNLLPEIQFRSALAVESTKQPHDGMPRLIAQARSTHDGAGYGINDSLHYSFSGVEGRMPNGNSAYSERINLQIGAPATTGRRSQIVYNPDRSVSVAVSQRWDAATNNWLNRQRQAFTYRRSRLVRDTVWNWDARSKSWAPAILTFYSRNGQGRPLRIVSLQWNPATGRLDSVADVRYRFDEQGNATECLSRYGTGRLQPLTRQEVSYNNAGIATGLMEYSWDSVNAAWQAASGYRFTLGSSGERLMQENYWGSAGQDGTRQAFSRYVYSYDSSGRLSRMDYETPTGTDLAWRAAEWTVYTYNPQGQRTSAVRTINAINSNGTTQPERAERVAFHYEQLATGHVPKSSNSGLRIWPVPATGHLNLDISAVSGQAYRATISDLQGRLLKSWNRAASTASVDRLELEGIPSGTFNLIVHTEAGRSFIARFIVAG